jgi:hypothetical protein
MKVTGWKSGRRGGTFGLRVGERNRDRFFNKRWRSADVDFGGKRVDITIGNGFWGKCPELRDPFVKVFLVKKGLVPWPKGHPPKMELTPCGENRFRIS